MHLLIDATGLPLAITLSGANVHDSRQLEATLDAVHGIHNDQPGRPGRRPQKRHADKGYDFKRCRTACRTRGIQPRIARRGVESSERLGRHRWKVERTFSWLMWFRKLSTRQERSADRFLALAHLACALLVWRRLTVVCPS